MEKLCGQGLWKRPRTFGRWTLSMATRQERDYENKSRGNKTGTWMKSVLLPRLLNTYKEWTLSKTMKREHIVIMIHMRTLSKATKQEHNHEAYSVPLLYIFWNISCFLKVVLDLQDWRGKAFPKGGCSWFTLQLKAVSWEIDALIDRPVQKIW